MATKLKTQEGLEGYLESFKRFENGAKGPEWLRSVREKAINRSKELGFPTVRDEDWKFTNLTPLARTRFRLAERGDEPSAKRLAAFRFDKNVQRLVFVNGRYAPGLSDAAQLPKGVVAGSLAAAFAEQRHLVESQLAQHADYDNDFFSALNTAFMEDGGFVYVPRNTVLTQPIHLLFVATAAPQATISHPRNLIIVEEVSQAEIIEEYVSLGGEDYFSNVVTELVVGESSVVEHYMIERESASAYNIGTLRIEQGRDSNVASHTVLFGGGLVRNNIHPVLAGEGAHCVINGLFMPTGRQHMDNFMRVEHASPHCDSRQFYNGILDQNAHGVFSGRIIVHKAAQKTDAKQTNRNLLLSDTAQIDSKPQLEIYADDVKCTHGATIGQLDDEALFYLRARGISEEAARALLLFGFATENLERMKLSKVREYVEELVTDRLPQGSMLKKLR